MITTSAQLRNIVDTLIIVSEGKIQLKTEGFEYFKDKGELTLYFESQGHWYKHDDVKVDALRKYLKLKGAYPLQETWL